MDNCIADCGCAGGQRADACTFIPSCPRCRDYAAPWDEFDAAMDRLEDIAERAVYKEYRPVGTDRVVGIVSPVVRRNLDCAQYSQSRGSQYEGSDW